MHIFQVYLLASIDTEHRGLVAILPDIGVAGALRRFLGMVTELMGKPL